MTWMKSKRAKDRPPETGHVDIEALMGKAVELERQGIAAPPLQYLRTFGPHQELDKWGQPLPLSSVEQDRLDRIFAVLAAPLERTRALLVSGILGPDEVEAVKAVYPHAYAVIVEEAVGEMIRAAPPFPSWVESVLAVLFQQPTAQVFNDGQQTSPDAAAPGAAGPRSGNIKLGGPDGTPADRREIAVREKRS